MVFYKVEAKIEIDHKDEQVKGEVDDRVLKLNSKIGEDPYKYCFIADIEGDTAVGGAVFSNTVDAESVDFPWNDAGLNIAEHTVGEITSEEFCSLVKCAEGKFGGFFHRKIVDRIVGCDVIGRNRFEGIFAGSNFYTESLIKSDRTEQGITALAHDALWDGIESEISRIYAVGNKTFRGHPVHYLLSSDNYVDREKISDNLLSALYLNNRLSIKRYCNVSVSNLYSEQGSAKNIESLYDCYVGGAVILRFKADARTDGDYSDVDVEYINAIAAQIKKHRNDVLTVFCFPRSCEKEKEFFFSTLQGMTVLEFGDGFASGDRIKEYVQNRVSKMNVEIDESLYGALSFDKTYTAAEIDERIDDWYAAKLKKDIYPEYAACAKIANAVEKCSPRGNAYDKLMSMVGLRQAKSVINKAVDYCKAQKLFADKGMPAQKPNIHMVFTGNPGTAKTTVARLFAEIMRDNGVLSGGHLVEVGRKDLVARYVGQTAPQVKAAFVKAKGGVLFIDEAYSLVDDRDGSFGDEAINTIVQEMENNRADTCVIFAGYPDKMQKFLDKNPGLRSRIAFNVEFDDYSVDELMEITDHIGKSYGKIVDSGAKDRLHGIYGSARESSDFGNGRFVRSILEKAQMAQASRLIGLGYDNVTAEDIKHITADDIEPLDLSGSSRKRKIGFAV